MHISYTKQAANAVRYAAKKAKEMKHPYIGTEHLLLGLREEFSGVAGQVLAQNGVETEKIMQLMDELIAPREEMPASQKPKESPRLRYILANSEKEAHRLRTAEVGTEHLLLSMTECPSSKEMALAGQILVQGWARQPLQLSVTV